jgi:hypothetical protein
MAETRAVESVERKAEKSGVVWGDLKASKMADTMVSS